MTGTVCMLQGRHYAFDEGPNFRGLTVRPGSEVGVELGAVPGAGTQLPRCPTERRLLTCRVRLEVPDDEQLPAHISGGWARVQR